MTYERSATLTPLTDAQMAAVEGGRFHWHHPFRDIVKAVGIAAAVVTAIQGGVVVVPFGGP
jgi:hypothetical protein